MSPSRSHSSSSQSLYQLFLIGFLGLAGGYGYFWGMGRYIDQQLITLNIEKTQAEAASLQANTSVEFKKYNRVKTLEQGIKIMPWHKHIPKVIEILETLRNQDPDEQGDTVQLSDFTVSLDTISLKGSVKNLALIHGSSRRKGVIDQFLALDFVKDMQILNYQNRGGRFDFTLQANININANKSK